MSDDYDWDDFPVISGQGSLHDLRDVHHYHHAGR
jgi:hypothetical protein